MNTSDAFHLGIATLLFVGLFSFTLLPPPLNQAGEAIQGIAAAGYSIVRAVGVVTDINICVLADLWNLGGIDATLESGETVTCAILTENKIAITPADRAAYGDELGGVLKSVQIKDKLTLNKLFYVSYVLFGLVLAAVLTDIYLSIRSPVFGAGQAIGYTIVAMIGITLVLFRTGAVWPVLSGFANVIPGNSMLADGLFLIFSMSLFWWVISQVTLGYHTTKESYKRFAAVRVAARADVDRGITALERAKNR